MKRRKEKNEKKIEKMVLLWVFITSKKKKRKRKKKKEKNRSQIIIVKTNNQSKLNLAKSLSVGYGKNKLVTELFQGFVAREIKEIKACMRSWKARGIIGLLDHKLDTLNPCDRDTICPANKDHKLLLEMRVHLMEHLPEVDNDRVRSIVPPCVSCCLFKIIVVDG